MKKFIMFCAAIAMTAAFVSCETETDTIVPSISKKGEMTVEGNNYEAIYTVKCDATAKLDAVTAEYTYGTTTVSLPKANLGIAETNAYEWVVTVTIPQEVEGEAVKSVTVIASVKNGGTKKETFNTPAPKNTDLDAAAAFTFKRAGSAAATGLDMFGLKWPQNNTKATFAYIEKDTATKLVSLTAAQWESIKTKEALAEAIDAAAEITRYKGVSADQGKDYNDVLGVINGETYYMLHITKATVDGQTSGTTVEINGQYKK